MDLQTLAPKTTYTGMFVEAWRLPSDGQISYLSIVPEEMRGNHYHKHKTEHFLVVSGSAQFRVKNRDTNNIMEATVSGNNPMAVTILPNHTHSLTATHEGCICIIWCDEQYNEADADTYPEEL